VIDPGDFLAAYDELRWSMPVEPPDVLVERDGPLVRTIGWPRGGFIEYGGGDVLEGDALEELIARQLRIFAARGERFEWKTHGHDQPADLHARLLAAGFVPEAQETVMAALVSEIVAEPALPAGVVLREASEDGDFERIAEMEARVWGGPYTRGLAAMLAGRRAFDPLSLAVYIAEAGDRLISAAWLRFTGDAAIVSLHGGATLAEWRGRGIYRALVAVRAGRAAERGCRYLHVDASDASRPILERLGFVDVTTSTPFMWSPP
jgi:GNAT superfamily N-acetyltransferase